jgi:ubiquinone/menaquinone biosynthesis C-methylase UbiE
MPQQPDYGLDGPIANAVLLTLGGALAGTAVVLWTTGAATPAGRPWTILAFALGADLLLVAAGMIGYSTLIKARLRERLLDQIPWRGDETVLDVGCGRGLWLVGAARRAAAGCAVGVDVWRHDLSGNRKEAPLENARREGVISSLYVVEADTRLLPLADFSCDLVVSCLVLHNIRDRPGRHRALREIARVTKPGGRVLLVDLRFTREYVRVLSECGFEGISRSLVGPIYSRLLSFLTCGAVQFASVFGSKNSSSRGKDAGGRMKDEG